MPIMEKYRITLVTNGSGPEDNDPGFNNEDKEFLIGIFLPKNKWGCKYCLIVGHSVIWYKFENKTYVISFTPEKADDKCKRCNALCRVPGEYNSVAEVHNHYTRHDVSLYNKSYYKVSYLNPIDGQVRINELHEIHKTLNPTIENPSSDLAVPKYKGFSTALCFNFCCLSGKKYNCTSILVKLLPNLGLESDLNHPFLIMIFNILMAFSTAYFIASIKQIFQKTKRSDFEISGVTFALCGLTLNTLYLLYIVLSSCCCRKGCNTQLNKQSWFKKNALIRNYVTQKWVLILNVPLFLLTLLSLINCTCPWDRFNETFAITASIVVFTILTASIVTFCIDCTNGCTNPYALRNVLDRAVAQSGHPYSLPISQHTEEHNPENARSNTSDLPSSVPLTVIVQQPVAEPPRSTETDINDTIGSAHSAVVNLNF